MLLSLGVKGHKPALRLRRQRGAQRVARLVRRGKFANNNNTNI